MTRQHSWLNGSVIYQIYPRSFYDSNSDGIGDLRGIINKLDYLAGNPHSLGVDGIWLSPIFTSPQRDFGYDVSDYQSIDPQYGSMQDFEELLREAHARGLKVLIDYIPNHTSDQHSWFQESRKDKDNSKRNWYIWRDPKPDGSPPNNWLSAFGGSAWKFDNSTQQYYLHSFFKEQPDLNWSNAEVRTAMNSVLEFWLKKGVDGFRVDAIYWMAKDPELRNDPVNKHYKEGLESEYDSLSHTHSRGQESLYTYLKELSGTSARFGDRPLIVEAYPEKAPRALEYLQLYERVNPSVLSPFNFEAMDLPWRAKEIKSFADGFQELMKPSYTPVYVLGNHDRPRLASRIKKRALGQAATFLLTMPGAAFMYYGDEIGMDNMYIKRKSSRDPLAKSPQERRLARDPERTPMQWSGKKRAGFSKVRSWLSVNNNYHDKNVAGAITNPRSLLNQYRSLLQLRHTNNALKLGSYEPVPTTNTQLFAFIRVYGDERVGVLLNFSSRRRVRINEYWLGDLLFSTSASPLPRSLRPFEARIIRLHTSTEARK